MNIRLNNQEIALKENVSLEQLFRQLNIKAATGVAVAVNESIIPKKDWASHSVNENDKILVITATQGG
jgi:sulfur carrier protein